MRKLIVLVLLAMMVVSCSTNEDIPFVQNSNGFYIKADDLSATDEHRMDLEAGEKLSVSAEVEKGFMSLVVIAPSGDKPFEGNFTEVKDSTITVYETGTYLFYVKLNRFTGRLEVNREISN